MKALNANTVEYPVYWNEIEPQEGRFEFGDFDLILRKALSEGLRVILLWFGTWKNGSMDWAPDWVKSDTARFPRVIDSGGKPIRNLSPHSKNNLDADRKAYVAMMRHLKEPARRDLSQRRSGVAHAGFVESGRSRYRHPLPLHPAG